MDVSLSELRELVMDREEWRAVIHGVAKSRTRLSDWSDLICTKDRPWKTQSRSAWQKWQNWEEQVIISQRTQDDSEPYTTNTCVIQETLPET